MTRTTHGRGFSIIELMISLALFGLIAAGAMSLVMSGARSQARSARIDVAQSGLRAGIDYLSRDLLSAGSGVHGGNLVNSAGTILSIIKVTNSNTAPDTIEIYSIDGSAVNSTGIPVTMTQAIAAGATTLNVDNSTPFAVGDVVQVGDLVNGVLASVTGKSATTLTLGAAIGTVRPAGNYVFKSRHVTYSVLANQFSVAGSGSVANGSALMIDFNDGKGAQPLAEGVEDLQVALGIDSVVVDGKISEVGAGPNDDEWVYNFAGEPDPVSLTNLKAVRFTIVAATTVSERGAFPKRPKAEDRAAGTVNDGFLRRVIRTEVAVRNFNL